MYTLEPTDIVAGAPGQSVVPRSASSLMLCGYSLRRMRHFGLTAAAVTEGVVALLLVLSMLRAHWDETPAGQAVVVSRPPVASSPGAGPWEGPGASAEGPTARPTLGPNTSIEEQGRPQGTLATVVLQAKTDPSPSDEPMASPLESLEALEGLTPTWESPPRPLASAPSAIHSQPAMGGSPSRAQASRTVPLQPSRSSPQVKADPATLDSAAKRHVAREISASDDGSAIPVGDIRVFIHYTANHEKDAALAQSLADHLRHEGIAVADIRPVDFPIRMPSVRYFFARDRAASQRLVEELGRFFKERTSVAPDRASDFTHFQPKPRPGNVEFWLPTS